MQMKAELLLFVSIQHATGSCACAI